LAAPIALQFGVTHSRTGSWAFIDPHWTKWAEQLHFETTWYGYDTVLPASGRPYDAVACFETRGFADAMRKREWGELFCILSRRQWFYFGSFLWGGKVYLSHADERHFSSAFLVVNAFALLGAVAWMLRLSKRIPLMLPPLVLLGAIWAEGSLIIPESRFVMALNVALWMFAVAGAYVAFPELWGRFRDRAVMLTVVARIRRVGVLFSELSRKASGTTVRYRALLVGISSKVRSSSGSTS
jgi:hypothetical protein